MLTIVEYVATGSREELEDLRAKLCATEEHEDELNDGDFSFDYDGEPTFSSLDNEHFFKEFGVLDGFDEMGVYWICGTPYLWRVKGGTESGKAMELAYPINEWKDGLYCFRFQFRYDGEENPLLRETIENFYKTVKIFYLDGYHNTNDTNLEFFADKFPTLIDGLHYVLNDEYHTAGLNCDELWSGEVMTIPETVEHNGETYRVTEIVDFMHHSDMYANGYGIGSKPKNLLELVIPPYIQCVGDFACAYIPSLRKVSIPDGCSVGYGAFMNCGIEDLTLGDVHLDMKCFSGTRVKDVEIPDSTSWTEYGDFGGFGQLLHFVKEEPESIFEGVFSDTPMSFVRQLEECRRGECSAYYFCHGLSSLFKKDSLVKPEDVFPEMSDEDLEWLRKKDNNYAVRNVVIYGMLHGYFTRDDHYMAKLFFLRNVRPGIMHDNDISLSLPEFKDLEAELNLKGVLSEEEKSDILNRLEEEKSDILNRLEKDRLEREKSIKEFDEELPF